MVVCVVIFFPLLCVFSLSPSLFSHAAALTHPSFFHLIPWVLLSAMSHRQTSSALLTLAFFCHVVASPAQTDCVRGAAWERWGEAVPPSLQTVSRGSRFLLFLSLPHSCLIHYAHVSAVWSHLHFCHAGHGSESNRANEHPEQNHWKAWEKFD